MKVIILHTSTNSAVPFLCARVVCVCAFWECHALSYTAVFEYLPDVWADAQSECKGETANRLNNLMVCGST